MSYIVVYQREDGSSGLEECENLDLAIVAAERLRNVDSVEHPRILKTEEVRFDFRPYYRVEVSDDAKETATADPVTTVPSTPPASNWPSAASKPASLKPPTPEAETAEETESPALEAQVEPAAATATTTEAAPTETATIDPWATMDSALVSATEEPDAPTPESVLEGTTPTGESIDYTKDFEDAAGEVTAATTGPTPDPAPVADDVVEANPSSGLFSAVNPPAASSAAADLDKLAEDVGDVVPPRRGLFGR